MAELSEASEIVKTGGGSFSRPRKSSKRAAEAFRGLGNRQNESLKLSEASEGSKRVAEAFRGLGRRQGRRPSLSGTKLSSLPRKGPSGTSAKFAGYQAKFPAPEGAVRDVGQVCRVPGKLRRRPQLPRGLGRRSNECRKSASTCAPLPPLRICPIFTPT